MVQLNLFKCTATKLNKITKLSRDDSKMVLKCLMPHFNKESLTSCFHKLNGKKAAGIDGVTKVEYGQNLDSNIEKLLGKMKSMSYRPKGVREVLIPKDGKKGSTRPLGISTFEDKIVQMQMANILTSIYEPIFRECSYGFRPSRGCHTAIKSLFHHLSNRTVETVIDVDLKNYFGMIRHEHLIKFLRLKIKDERFIRYVSRMLKAGIFKEGRFEVSENGSPQGNIVSPILSNIYAHYVLDLWLEVVVPKYTKREVRSFRYADDQVICCQYRSDAVKIMRALKQRLNKFGLELNTDKTKIVKFGKWNFNKTKQGTFDYLGFTFYLKRSSTNGLSMAAIKTSRKRMTSKLRLVKTWLKLNVRKIKLLPLWKRFNQKLIGHIQYYGVSLNLDSVSDFIHQATKVFFKWINKRSQRRSINWEKFSKFIEAFSQPKPKIVHHLF